MSYQRTKLEKFSSIVCLSAFSTGMELAWTAYVQHQGELHHATKTALLLHGTCHGIFGLEPR